MLPFDVRLKQLMGAVNISSYRQLSRQSQVPRSQILRLRQGQLDRLPLGSLQRLSRTLNLSLGDLLQVFQSPMDPDLPPYETLNLATEVSQTAVSEEALRSWQAQALNILESLLLQLPTAAYAARQNPAAPAVRLLPLLKPIDQLLASWGVETIGQVGETCPYNPQDHQWLESGQPPDPGDGVRVRYVGYRQGSRLLHRAKVVAP
ncbi:helix-turn-helix domain-containing protein [Lyngbya confervoides]|uniref:Helix-turn-helix domain-containing protein n=1 Tax=Lyngbya confervoides BDU141951 TaxID=1574623 RepID=A0ABD4T8D9_9CYAN|nr:helix-turn-helix domain-containing protein [Lyngbya confervoides]MCM1984709.1 helix-turn-helix domain-containing protein [Lyngbya confervoides BDU141951]